MSYFNKLKNNWKKFVFASAALGYGVYSLRSYYEISSHMILICNEVKNQSERNNGFMPSRVLVVLNPVANNKNAEKSFKKYCEPILHLAGYSVEIFRTNYVGHAKQFVEHIKCLPDAIVVAGGDGTSSEVVTGLLRRNEPPCPIVLLPLGSKNETALKYTNLTPNSDLDYVKCLSRAVRAMLYQKEHHENVIKFDVIQNENNSSSDKHLKPIYGLNRFSWGVLRDIEAAKDKYWYFGNLRYYAAVLLNAFSKDLSWKFSTDFIYSPPCPGCRNCIVERKQQHIPKSYLKRLLPIKMSDETSIKRHIGNKNCETQIQGHIETNQINIACKRNTNAFYELETIFIKSLNPGLDFIKDISNITQNKLEPSLTLKSRTIQLVPTSVNENNKFYSIDGEEYDVRAIKVSIIPNAIKILL